MLLSTPHHTSQALVPFPSHVPNMTLELMPTWDHPEGDGFVILASTAIGPYRPRLRAVLSANRTTSLRAIFNGSYFYFRYYEQVLASNYLELPLMTSDDL